MGERPRPVTAGRSAPIHLLAGCVLLAAFGLAAYSDALHLPVSGVGDETAYFDESCWIAEHGGAWKFPVECLAGRYPYDNRHPLLQWCASPMARRSLDAVRPLRTVKASLAVAALAVALLLLARGLPSASALFLVSFLCLTENWATKAGAFVVEPVVYAAFLLGWALTSGVARPRGRWFLAGAASGLTWLAKGTGLLLVLAALPATLIWCIAPGRRVSALRTRARRCLVAVALFVVGFGATGWPLLVRNAVRFGNPLHNFNERVMWMDSFDETRRAPAWDEPDRYTLAGYLHHHTAQDIIRRLAHGTWHQLRRMLGAYAADRSFGGAARWPTAFLSIVIVASGVVATVRRRGTWRNAYTLSLLVLSFALFAWYSSITVSSRFMATLAPVLGFQALAWRQGPLGYLPRRFPRAWKTAAAGAAVLSAMLLLSRVEFSRLDLPRGTPATSPEFAFLLDWLQKNAQPGGGVTLVTPDLWPRYEMFWLLPEGREIRSLPPAPDYQALERYIEETGARYMIVERDSLHNRLDALGAFFGYDEAGALAIKRLPPGWRVIVRDPWPPLDFVILERSGSAATRATGQE